MIIESNQWKWLSHKCGTSDYLVSSISSTGFVNKNIWLSIVFYVIMVFTSVSHILKQFYFDKKLSYKNLNFISKVLTGRASKGNGLHEVTCNNLDYTFLKIQFFTSLNSNLSDVITWFWLWHKSRLLIYFSFSFRFLSKAEQNGKIEYISKQVYLQVF